MNRTAYFFIYKPFELLQFFKQHNACLGGVTNDCQPTTNKIRRHLCRMMERPNDGSIYFLKQRLTDDELRQAIMELNSIGITATAQPAWGGSLSKVTLRWIDFDIAEVDFNVNSHFVRVEPYSKNKKKELKNSGEI